MSNIVSKFTYDLQPIGVNSFEIGIQAERVEGEEDSSDKEDDDNEEEPSGSAAISRCAARHAQNCENLECTSFSRDASDLFHEECHKAKSHGNFFDSIEWQKSLTNSISLSLPPQLLRMFSYLSSTVTGIFPSLNSVSLKKFSYP